MVENGRAVGVEIVAGTGTETLHADREVIVTSGAIGSPRLLQLSGIGPADHLRRPASRSCTTCRASARTCRIISTST